MLRWRKIRYGRNNGFQWQVFYRSSKGISISKRHVEANWGTNSRKNWNHLLSRFYWYMVQLVLVGLLGLCGLSSSPVLGCLTAVQILLSFSFHLPPPSFFFFSFFLVICFLSNITFAFWGKVKSSPSRKWTLGSAFLSCETDLNWLSKFYTYNKWGVISITMLTHVTVNRVLTAFLSINRAYGIINLHVVQAPVVSHPSHFEVTLNLVASTHGYWRI